MFADSSGLTNVTALPWGTLGGRPGLPLRLVSPGMYWKSEIRTWLAKSPAGRGWEGRSHGALPRATPHRQAGAWPHGRFGTPSVRLRPTVWGIFLTRTLRTSVPERE